MLNFSKYFVMKSMRNEESIKTLKAVNKLIEAIDENQQLTDLIDTIRDNLLAQNHIFMMIDGIEDEIEQEMLEIADICSEM
jgi:hypothetical protein